MPIGISDLAHSVRKHSAAAAVPVSLGHSHQLIAAALGYKTFAAHQAAQTTAQESPDLSIVHHAVLDYDLLDQRAGELVVAPTQNQLHELINTAFGERAPHIHLHISYEAFEEAVRGQVEHAVMRDDNVNSEMANANYDGVNEVYFDFEVEFEQIAIGSSLDIDLSGHVGLGIDIERPYAGHIVNVEGSLSLDRLGRHCFGSLDCQVTDARLDRDWGDHEDGPPIRSLVQAYADLLGLELHEVENLADVEVIPLDGNSGDMTYGYQLDFTDYAPPEIARKILQRHGSLCIDVEPSFFDNVRHDDWPR